MRLTPCLVRSKARSMADVQKVQSPLTMVTEAFETQAMLPALLLAWRHGMENLPLHCHIYIYICRATWTVALYEEDFETMPRLL